MGIKGATKFFKSKSKNSFFEVILDDSFRGMRIAVDMGIIIYSTYAQAKKTVIENTSIIEEEPDKREILRNWISFTIDKFKEFLNVGATPLLIFDGGIPDEKKDVLEKRIKEKEFAI